MTPHEHHPNIEEAEKIIYLKIIVYKEQWSNRKMKGFKQERDQFQEVFENRFGKVSDYTFARRLPPKGSGFTKENYDKKRSIYSIT